MVRALNFFSYVWIKHKSPIPKNEHFIADEYSFAAFVANHTIGDTTESHVVEWSVLGAKVMQKQMLMARSVGCLQQ
jgi:hypothetical protein